MATSSEKKATRTKGQNGAARGKVASVTPTRKNKKMALAQVQLQISFPTPAGCHVDGNGGFFAWGFTVPGYANVQASIAGFSGIAIEPPFPCDWAFVFQGVPLGNQVLTVTANASGFVQQTINMNINVIDDQP